MADSALSKAKDEVVHNESTDRLKEALGNYLRARAEHTVSQLGHKLGESVTKLGTPGEGGPLKSLAKGGQALADGKSPAQAAMSAGVSHLKDTVKDKVKGLFGKGRKSGGGKSKSVTIVEDIEVGVPVREAYDQWTQFQEFSTFAKGVVSVEKADDTTSNWKVKVAKSTRSWKANVTEQVPDERITWTTEGAKGTVKGVVTFHAITDNLTKVLLVLEYFPKGLFEKTGNIWRAQGRRARLDLKLYRKFIMMRGEATDGWRGEIRDGDVVVSHEDAIEQEEAEQGEEEQDEPRAEEEGDGGEPTDAADADADDLEDDEFTDEAAEDEEPAEDGEDEYLDEAEEDVEPEDAEEYEAEADEPEDEESYDEAEEEPEADEETAPRSSRRRRTADAGA
ncbi:cyclase [Streptomyces sp. SID1328]|uniref:SRPBCC family protein n=1 Tax=Streptomyces sp. SID1328 TaxID=2690250 RepID=UPI00136F0269|nr:SRPBCC family protein [Streptomyces sp. SID1328]MYV43856.1 cyclase [Streptomyces sp. SID1328]